MTLTSYNKFVNGVCDIGDDCDAFIAANPTFFENTGNGPFDLRPFGRSGLDADDPIPVGRRDLLLLRAGIEPPTDVEDVENNHKVLLFWLGQHGDEWFLNYDAVVRLLKKLDDDFLDGRLGRKIRPCGVANLAELRLLAAVGALQGRVSRSKPAALTLRPPRPESIRGSLAEVPCRHKPVDEPDFEAALAKPESRQVFYVPESVSCIARGSTVLTAAG